MVENSSVSRRDFIKTASAAGTGLVIGFYLPSRNPLEAAEAGLGKPFVPNAWITIQPDNQITIIAGKSEMGQGVWTSLPMIIAEEMDADWSKVKIEQGVATRETTGSFTGGSTSVRNSWTKLRKAGATAREMLLTAAAREWKVSKSDCTVKNSTISHPATSRQLTFGQLTVAASTERLPKKVALKDPSQFKLIGTDIPRKDTPLKVDGSAQFAMDVDLAGMVYAMVVRSPSFGGTVKNMDLSRAEMINGILNIFEVSNGVAVVGSTTWAVLQARDLLDITWGRGKSADLDSESITKQLTHAAGKKGATGRKEGNPERALRNAGKVINAVYEVPFQAHATMEPVNCVVDIQPDLCRIWAPTQAPVQAIKQAAEITGLPEEKVQMHVSFLGGGFGRKSFNDFLGEAREGGHRIKNPVKLVWKREDDTRHDYYRPPSRHIMSGSLDKDGELDAWKHKVVAPSILFTQIIQYPFPFKDKLASYVALEGAKNIPYEIPHMRIEYKSIQVGVPLGWWRSVYDSQNGYANECFMDEMAHTANVDPVKFRLNRLKNSPRDARVLRLAAEKAGWGNKLPDGHFQGVANHASFGSYVAQVAELSVADDGTVNVHKVICAVDCGQVVNPSIVKAQMESAITYGLSATLKSEITIKNGEVVQSNFDDFDVLRIDEMPEVKVYIVKSTEAPGGVGEPGLPPIAPAVTNAVFAATGKRVRKLPIKPEQLVG